MMDMTIADTAVVSTAAVAVVALLASSHHLHFGAEHRGICCPW